MVAKSFRTCLIGFSLMLSACQTIRSSNDSIVMSENSDIPSSLSTQQSELDDAVGSESEQESEPKLDPTDMGPESVVSSLQLQALQFQADGKWKEAGLVLERAMRIDASKLDLYHQLATVRMGQKRFVEAEQIALRGLAFSGENAKYKASIWQVIAQCRSASSDIKGANEAREKVLFWLNQE